MYSLGIDIGGTKCAVILGRGSQNFSKDDFIIDKISFPTNVERGYALIIEEIFGAVDEILKRNSVVSAKDELTGIGISCGGPLDSRLGIIECPPNLPDWDNVHIKEMFENRYHVRTNLQNDANACAVAEWKFGAGRGLSNMIFLTFGTGMGAGLILDGKLYSGTNDLAGEVGHMRIALDGPEGYGKCGSFEGFCSGGGIARLAKAVFEQADEQGIQHSFSDGKTEISAKTVAIAAKNGDVTARRVYDICAEKLGLGLSVLIDILNPEAIVIGSIYQRDAELFDEIISRVIKEEALPGAAGKCRILPALLGGNIGDFAALGLSFGTEE